MYKQNDVNLNRDIQDVGCFYLSCINLIEFKTGIKLTVEEVNFYWNLAKSKNIIDDNNNLLDSAKLMNIILGNKGSDLRVFEIATEKDYYNRVYYQWVDDTLKNRDKYYIQKLKTTGKYGTHFRVVTENGNIYDSIDGVYDFEKVLYNIVYVFVSRG